MTAQRNGMYPSEYVRLAGLRARLEELAEAYDGGQAEDLWAFLEQLAPSRQVTDVPTGKWL